MSPLGHIAVGIVAWAVFPLLMLGLELPKLRRRRPPRRPGSRGAPNLVVGWIRDLKIAWISALVGIAVVLIGYLAPLPSYHRDFTLNVFAEVFGILAAVGIAVGIVDARARIRQKRIEDASFSALRRVQGHAANATSLITGILYGFPRDYYSSGGGEYWFFRNIPEIHNLLQGDDPRRIRNLSEDDRQQLAKGPPTNPDLWRWIFDELDNLLRDIEYTERIFGPALLEYPNVIAHFRRIVSMVETEKELVGKFIAAEEQIEANRAVHNSRIPYDLRWMRSPSRLPFEALGNRHRIAVQTMRLSLAINAIIKDWKVNLPESDPDPSIATTYLWEHPREYPPNPFES